MKFLFVISSLGGGGAEKVAVNLANSLTEMGYSVTIFSRRYVEDPYNISSKVEIRYQNRRGFLYGAIELRNIVKGCLPNCVISFTDIPNILAFAALRSSYRSSKIIYIPTVHNDLVARDAGQHQGIRFKFIRYLHKSALGFSGRVVVVSNGAKSSLMSYYGLALSRIETIYNPTIDDQEDFMPHRVITENRNIRLVSAGRLTPQKNYRLMIEAISKLYRRNPGHYTLDIYGQGELKEELKCYARNLGVESVVSFRGFVSDLKPRLPDYDMFLLSSSWEGFGNVLVEALCAGIPIVSTDCPSGPREILADGKFGRLVPIGNVEAFCEAIEEEIRQPLEIPYDELCDHLDNFRYGVVAQKYIDLVKHAEASTRKD